jgi:hypothetical protein
VSAALNVLLFVPPCHVFISSLGKRLLKGQQVRPVGFNLEVVFKALIAFFVPAIADSTFAIFLAKYSSI